MSRKLYVGNLPYEIGEADLQALFAQAGAVESVTVMRDQMTGRARGFAFVEMGSDEDAQKAITTLTRGSSAGARSRSTKRVRRPSAAAAAGATAAAAASGAARSRAGSKRAEPCVPRRRSVFPQVPSGRDRHDQAP